MKKKMSLYDKLLSADATLGKGIRQKTLKNLILAKLIMDHFGVTNPASMMGGFRDKEHKEKIKKEIMFQLEISERTAQDYMKTLLIMGGLHL